MKNQAKKDLLIAMRGILENGFTREAIKNSSLMKFEDVVANLHLWERLGTAHTALGFLNGYRGQPKGYFNKPIR